MKRLLLVPFVSVVCAGSLAAQLTIPGSDKETLAILPGGPSLNLDVTQAKVGLTLLKEFACRGESGANRERCLSDVTRDHLDLTGHFAAAAQDGKRTLFAGGDITPGLEIGGSLRKYWESSTGGYTAFYVPLLGKLSQTKTAAFQGATALLSNETTKTLGSGLGIIKAFTESRALGVSLNVQRHWDSPGLKKNQQVCTETGAGTDTGGNSVRGSKCEDRVYGPLVDETVIQPRLESLLHFPHGDQPSFGLITSLSGAKRTGASMSYSAAVGPTLHPAGRPREVLAAILFSFTDFTDANDRELTFNEIFAVKLYLAVPLTGF